MAVRHAFEDVLEVGERFDAVELCRGNERADSSPTRATAIRTGEQMILAAKGDGPDGPLDRVVRRQRI